MDENFDADKEEEHLYSHPAGKSKVWMHFGFRKNIDGNLAKDKVVCRICRMSITYSGNTTNMSYHLGKNHPLSYRALGLGSSKSGNDCGNPNLPKQLSVEKAFLNAVPYDEKSIRHKNLVNATGKFISQATICG